MMGRRRLEAAWGRASRAEASRSGAGRIEASRSRLGCRRLERRRSAVTFALRRRGECVGSWMCAASRRRSAVLRGGRGTARAGGMGGVRATVRVAEGAGIRDHRPAQRIDGLLRRRGRTGLGRCGSRRWAEATWWRPERRRRRAKTAGAAGSRRRQPGRWPTECGRRDAEHGSLELWTSRWAAGGSARCACRWRWGRRCDGCSRGGPRCARRRVHHHHGSLELRSGCTLQIEPALLAGRGGLLVLGPTVRTKHSAPR